MQLTLDGHRTDVAEFSPDGVYRYMLTRELGGDRALVICGLNPSVATAAKNDRTVRKEMGFAKLWGFGRLYKVNANAYVAQDPNDMKRAAKAGVDIVGPDNDTWLHRAVEVALATDGMVLVGWGQNIDPRRQAEIAYIFGDHAMCLGVNKDGSPEHPLYVPYSRPLQHWNCP